MIDLENWKNFSSIFLPKLQYTDLDTIGTAKDNLTAPVHRWYHFPAGFSNKFITSILSILNISKEAQVFDPFVGTGTTVICANNKGIESVGFEAHPHIFKIAKAKTLGGLDQNITDSMFNHVLSLLENKKNIQYFQSSEFHPLLRKCYSENNLAFLNAMKRIYKKIELEDAYRDLLYLSISQTLKESADVIVKPYPVPSKRKKQKPDARIIFKNVTKMILDDLNSLNFTKKHTKTKIVNHDSRQPSDFINPSSIDLVITSPPYLNNLDYGEITRLETTFWEYTKIWSDITEKVRSKLVTASTTHFSRQHFPNYPPFEEQFIKNCPYLANAIEGKVFKLAELRQQKGGKKDYDILIAQYFSDMYKVFKNIFRYLKNNSYFVLVLADSAPYGVYIPTDVYLGQMALEIGFKSFKIEKIRDRGSKWMNLTHRHKLKLRESLLVIQK